MHKFKNWTNVIKKLLVKFVRGVDIAICLWSSTWVSIVVEDAGCSIEATLVCWWKWELKVPLVYAKIRLTRARYMYGGVVVILISWSSLLKLSLIIFNISTIRKFVHNEATRYHDLFVLKGNIYDVFEKRGRIIASLFFIFKTSSQKVSYVFVRIL